jgi:hypothetical protein
MYKGRYVRPLSVFTIGPFHSEKRFIGERFNYLFILFPGEAPLNPVADLFFAAFVKLSDQVRVSSQTLTIPKHNPENKSRLKVVLAAAFSGNKTLTPINKRRP